jgi:hypothetical protein
MGLRGKEVGGRLIILGSGGSADHNKYRAVKTTVAGQTYDSRKEAEYCQGLKYLERAGEIRDLKLQVPFEIFINEQLICKYIADATYYEVSDGSYHVVDVKGYRTKEFRLKKKLMKAVFNITVEEV